MFVTLCDTGFKSRLMVFLSFQEVESKSDGASDKGGEGDSDGSYSEHF